MRLTVFDVEHGACALLELPNGKRVMIDCGHNGKTRWRPGTHLKSKGIKEIEALFVTNYDEDHVSGIEDLFDNVLVRNILRNRKVSTKKIKQLKSEDGMGNGIDFLIRTLDACNAGKSIDDLGLDGLTVKVFSNSPDQFDDENNLSLVVFLEYQGWKFVFPGDMESEGWEELLKQADFRKELKTVDIFFASHHGRENGCSEEVFEYCNPFWVVISDKAKGHQTQETTDWYASFAKGGPFEGKKRFVLTTRKDGSIQFEVLDRKLSAKAVSTNAPKYQKI